MTGQLYGYARVSTQEQDETSQLTLLQNAGCAIIRFDKASGKSRAGRTQLDIVLAFLRPGDTLVVTRLDRLARNVKDVLTIVEDLKARNIGLRATEQDIVDTKSASGWAFFQMLCVFAEFETNTRKERQQEGIAEAKLRGVYKGRKAKIDKAVVEAEVAAGLDARAVAKKLGISRPSVYRLAGHLLPKPQPHEGAPA
jgi:DNA invertase Pin-like site-specific DNA recombinase